MSITRSIINITSTNTHFFTGFSINTWIIIFIFAIFGIVILPVVFAGALKTIRSYSNESDDNINSERTETGPLYETEATNPHAAALPNIVSRLHVHPLATERYVAHTSTSNVENVLYSLQQHSTIPYTFDVDKNLTNENDADHNSDISSTHSLETSLNRVYEAPYVNHYQPLSISFDRVPHVYDECCVE